MLFKSKNFFTLLLMIVFLLAGCISSKEYNDLSKGAEYNSVNDQNQWYPIETPRDKYLPTDYGYPAPDVTPYVLVFPDHIIIPTLTNDTGIILGRMVTKNGSNNPYLATAIYLGEVIEPDNPMYPPLISLDDEVNPMATQDKAGNFIFENIKPGNYGLIIWSPFSQTLIEDPNRVGFPLLIEVKEGELVDIGTVIIP